MGVFRKAAAFRNNIALEMHSLILKGWFLLEIYGKVYYMTTWHCILKFEKQQNRKTLIIPIFYEFRIFYGQKETRLFLG